MTSVVENPFTGYGRIVSGKRFLGRKAALQSIECAIFDSDEPNNLAIIGEPRIGKSSLAYEAIMTRKKDLLNRSIVPIWLNLARYKTPIEFFCALVNKCKEELTFNTLLYEVAEDVLRVESDIVNNVHRFFIKVREAHLYVLFIIDEFDHARVLFKNEIAPFQVLRDLAYYPDHRVSFITTSRRSIYDIEMQTRALSTLDSLFQKLYLQMFNKDDLLEYFHYLEYAGLNVKSGIKKKIHFYTGGHPYLLAMLSYDLIETFRTSNVLNVTTVMQIRETDFIAYYDHIVGLLREELRLSKLLQILFGPAIDVSGADVNHFLRYGLITKGSKGFYIAFSAHFEAFLRMIDRNTESWPIWRQTEKALRLIIAQTLQQAYGDQWFKKLEQTYPRLALNAQGKNLFQRCRDAQQREKLSWGGRASTNLLDYTYSQELFDLIFQEWAKFSSIFGKDKKYWTQRSQLLSKVRNPLAHNREEVLSEAERLTSQGYCREILDVLSKSLPTLLS